MVVRSFAFIFATAMVLSQTCQAAVSLPWQRTQTDAVVTAQLKGCLERESPDCAQPWLQELGRRFPGSLTLRYVSGHVAFLRGNFDFARTSLQQAVQAPPGFEVMVKSAKEILARVRASQAAIAGFEHQTISGGHFVVWYQPGADEVMIPWMERVLNAATSRLSALIGALPPEPINIHIYPRSATLAEVSGLTQAQVRRSGTIALCKFNRLMLTSPRDLLWGYPWADTLVHELVHLLVQRHGGAHVPVWLHEAMARTLEEIWRNEQIDGLDAQERWLLSEAARRRKLIPLRRMHPTLAALPNQFAAQTAFAEVHHALLWLRSERRARGRSDSFQSLLRRLRKSAKPMDAIGGWVPESDFPTSWWRQLRRHRKLRPIPTGWPRILRFRGDRKQKAKGAGHRHLTLANRLLALHRPKAAVIEYRRAFRAGVKGDPLVWARMARALLALNRPEEAERYLEGVQDRNYAPIWVVKGQIALAQNSPSQALEHARRAIYLNPADPRIHRLRALAWRRLGDSDRADAAVAAARQVESTD